MPRWMLLCLIGLATAAAAPVHEADSSEESEEGSGGIDEGSGEVDEEPLTSIVSHYKPFIGQRTFKVPFMTRIEKPFVNGQTIHALGTINRMPTEIEFGFHKGSDKGADMPLHLSIRFDEGKMIYNTFTNGTWSDKEQKIDNPFEAGKDFDLRIRIIDNKYHVFANRKDIGKFDIQEGLDAIDHVSLKGDLDYLHLFRYSGYVFPENYLAIANLVPGKRLDISGLATGKRFTVSLLRENKEYALQLSVRFHEKVIARNGMENNMWGKEERDGGFIMNKGEVFDLTLVNDESSIQIYVNGQRFGSFVHRGKPSDLKTLEVEGDVELHTIDIKDVVAA